MKRSHAPGLYGIVQALQNHYLIKANELRKVREASEKLGELSARGAKDTEGLSHIFEELKQLANEVIDREIGSATYEGVPLRWLERAVELAERAQPEDNLPRPRVGAVILNDGELVGEASRNQDGVGGHAEQLAIETCRRPNKLIGSTLVSTLEPCTTRGSKGRRPCVEILLRYGIKKVVIGHLDPNPAVRGDGDLILRKNNIAVSYFPWGLAQRSWILNADFVAHSTAEEFQEVFLFHALRRNRVPSR